MDCWYGCYLDLVVDRLDGLIAHLGTGMRIGMGVLYVVDGLMELFLDWMGCGQQLVFHFEVDIRSY